MERLTKTMLAFALLLCVGFPTLQAQVKKYGYLHYGELFSQMPELPAAKAHLDTLRAKYRAETDYNETSFNRQFAEFLQGQKDFPQSILMKRQRDLQEAMERGIAFRQEADTLLAEAEREIVGPIYSRLDEAIRKVGLERGYEYIIDLDQNAFPFLHPDVSEDATPYVMQKIHNE